MKLDEITALLNTKAGKEALIQDTVNRAASNYNVSKNRKTNTGFDPLNALSTTFTTKKAPATTPTTPTKTSATQTATSAKGKTANLSAVFKPATAATTLPSINLGKVKAADKATAEADATFGYDTDAVAALPSVKDVFKGLASKNAAGKNANTAAKKTNKATVDADATFGYDSDAISALPSPFDGLSAKTAASKKSSTGAASGASNTAAEKTDVGKLLKGAVLKGLDAAATGTAETLDWCLGGAAQELWNITGLSKIQETNPLTSWKEKLEAGKAQNEAYFAANASHSKLTSIVDQYGTETVAAVPMALISVLSGFLGAAATATTSALKAAAEIGEAGSAASALRLTANAAVKKMVSDPNYWTAFLQVAGGNYNEAKADGATDDEANLFALTNGTLNAIVETASGIQVLPKKVQIFLRPAKGKSPGSISRKVSSVRVRKMWCKALLNVLCKTIHTTRAIRSRPRLTQMQF